MLHEAEDKSLRLIIAALETPLDLTMEATPRNKAKKVNGETYWMDAFAGPPDQPAGAMPNTLFPYQVPMISLREYAWWNFMSVMVIDLFTFGRSDEDLALRALFRSGAPRWVRALFKTGKVVGRSIFFTVLVFDTDALVTPKASEISNMPQSKFASSIFIGDRIWFRGTDSYGVIVAIRARQSVAPGNGERTGMAEVRVSYDCENKEDEWHELRPTFPGILVRSCL